VGDTTIVCPGSTVPTSFSERGAPKGTALWELGRTITWRFVDLPTRTRRVVDPSARGRAELDAVGPGDLVCVRSGDADRDRVWARGGWVAQPPKKEGRAAATPSRAQLTLL